MTETTSALLDSITEAKAATDAIDESAEARDGHVPADLHFDWNSRMDAVILASADCILDAAAKPGLRRLLTAILQFSDARDRFERQKITGMGGAHDYEVYRGAGVGQCYANIVSAVDGLEDPDPQPPELESVLDLVAQKLSEPQIARIFATTSPSGLLVSPFHDEHGACKVDRVRKEIALPASVLTKDFKHPRLIELQRQISTELRELRRLVTAAGGARMRIADTSARGELEHAL